MSVLKTIRDYFFYCGIEKDEYNALKKDAYVANFRVWRILHFLMAAVFGLLFFASLFYSLMEANKIFYLIAFLYSAAAVVLFFVIPQDSIIAQFLIYLSISFLFLIACFITQNKPDTPATTFIVFLLIAPMFMIDKPFFMTIELVTASCVFLFWMYRVKPFDVWQYDLINVVTFTVVGCFLNVIANAIRIKEFVLTRIIGIQKDTDEMTGLRNKGALTREINAFLNGGSSDKGILLMLDVDRFKSINDTYGHDVGDRVIAQLGGYLASRFTDGEITGRFGGDEFIVFIKGADDPQAACQVADDVIRGAAESVALPDDRQKFSVSVGIAVYTGREKNYSEIFKKADVALYAAKADPDTRRRVYEDPKEE